MDNSSSWLKQFKQLRSLAQIGKTYSKDPYDLERYDQIERLAHDMLAVLSGEPIEKINNLFIPDKGYATPKIDLRGGIIAEGKILLVRERLDGKWSLPGGWADECESPSAGVLREIREESGYEASQPRLIAVIDRSLHPYSPIYPYHIYKLFFLCKLTGGTPTPNLEVDEIGFFGLEDIPPLSTSKVLEADIERFFRFAASPTLPVVVD